MENQEAFNEEFLLSEGNYSFEESNQMKFTNFLDLSSIFQPISILHDGPSLLNETERQQIEEQKTISGNRVHSNGNLFSNVVDQEEKENFSKREKSFSKSKGQKDRTGIQTFSNGFKIDSQCSDNISGIQKGQCNEFDFVFKQQKIKGKYHKNTNVPKMLVRIFVKYFSSFVAGRRSLLLRHHAEIKKEMQERPTNNYKIPDVLKLLEAGCEQFEGAGTQNRRTMAEIILKTMEQEIILNRFVKRNEMSYMLAMKIYALRCRSRKLVERVKIM